MHIQQATACESIQFVAGLALRSNTSGSEVVVSYGINDCESDLLPLAVSQVLAMLRPLTSVRALDSDTGAMDVQTGRNHAEDGYGPDGYGPYGVGLSDPRDNFLEPGSPKQNPESPEVMRLKEQVRELQTQLEAKESQNQELMTIAGHVRQQEAARKHAEEKLKMAQEAAEAEAAKTPKLFHMVCQVDREVAARRDAEKRMESASASARQAVAKASEEVLAATARAAEAEERAKLIQDERRQLEVRLTEKEAQLAPLRAQLAKASQAASENQILSNSLQEQLAVVVKTSESRAANCADAKARASRAEQQATYAREESEAFSARVAEMEKERDDLNHQLEVARKDYGELQKAQLESRRADLIKASLICCQANRNKEIVDQLRGDIQSMENEISELHDQLKAAKADTADWCERAMVAADQLAQGEGKASSTFLRKFPAAQAVAVLFKHLLSQADETLEGAVKQRLFLHGQYLSRHELNQFLTDFAGFRQLELSVVSQALFGVLDLEREGQVPQDLLMERMLEPPSMKDVWLADLPSLWPGRDTVVQYARRSGAWSLPSPHRLSRSSMSRPRNSRPGSACTAPGTISGRRPSNVSASLPVPKAPAAIKRPSTACSRSRRDQEGLPHRKDRRSSAPEGQEAEAATARA
eukprot:symbB.v1.2.018736.t1/scaffold1478.1/size117722/5